MIINIAGTSGAGKSTAMRAIKSQFSWIAPYYLEYNQDKIMGYCGYLNNKKTVIIGSYASPTGGCDNIPNLQMVFQDVEEFARQGIDVLFEGLLVSRSKGRLLRLYHQFNPRNLFVYYLVTPLEDCIEGINQRRRERGELEPVNRQRTEETFNRVKKIVGDLKALGVPVYFVTRDEVVERILEQLQNETC